MAKPKSKTQENFGSEVAFHQWEWRVQRIGWVFIALVPLLALAGVFGGGGPLNVARVGDEATGTIEYERYTRKGDETMLTVEPAISSGSSGTVQVALPSDYFEAFVVEQIAPEPARAQLTDGRILYEFEHRGQGAAIIFYLQPRHIGSHTTSVAIGAGEAVTLRQFTYP